MTDKVMRPYVKKNMRIGITILIQSMKQESLV